MAQQKNNLHVRRLCTAIQWLMLNNKEWKQYCSIPFQLIKDSIQNPTIIQTCSILPDDDIELETNEYISLMAA
jgi:hypothetical protein